MCRRSAALESIEDGVEHGSGEAGMSRSACSFPTLVRPIGAAVNSLGTRRREPTVRNADAELS